MAKWGFLRLVWLLCGAGCARVEPPGEPPPVALVGEQALTAADIKRELERLSPDLQRSYRAELGRREFVDALVDKRLLVAEARRRGLDRDAAIHDEVEQLEARLIVKALLNAETRGAATEAELRAYYEAHKEAFARPAGVRLVRATIEIVPGDGSGIAAARAELGRLAAAVRPGDTLAVLSAPKPKPSKGAAKFRVQVRDLGWVERGGTDDRGTEEAGFALGNSGAVSPVYDMPGAVAVVQLAEKRAAAPQPFDAARSAVAGAFEPQRQRKAYQALVARLRKENPVSVDYARAGDP